VLGERHARDRLFSADVDEAENAIAVARAPANAEERAFASRGSRTACLSVEAAGRENRPHLLQSFDEGCTAGKAAVKTPP